MINCNLIKQTNVNEYINQINTNIMITKTINIHEFRQAFVNMDRQDNFSYDGLEALFNHLEYLSDEFDEPIELDVIAFCCEYSEVTEQEIKDMYDLTLEEFECQNLLINVENTNTYIIANY